MLKPDHGMAHNNLARVLIDQGALADGLESARRAVALMPDFTGAHANCAGALLGLERFAEAEAALRRALTFSRSWRACILISAARCRRKSCSMKRRPPTDKLSNCSPILPKLITISPTC